MVIFLKLDNLNPKNFRDEVLLCVPRKGFEKAVEEKVEWLGEKVKVGLRAKIAYKDEKPLGFVEYIPIENAPNRVSGKDLMFITCIWVPKEYRGGVGDALLKACFEDSKDKKGICVLAYDVQEYMPKSFFEKYGFETVEKEGICNLMLKKFKECENPKFLEKKYEPKTEKDRVVVDVLYDAQCPWSIKTIERLKKVLEEFKDVEYYERRADDREALQELGIASGIFVNGKEKFWAPPSEDEIREKIKEEFEEIK